MFVCQASQGLYSWHRLPPNENLQLVKFGTITTCR